jgi:hypothetical protein
VSELGLLLGLFMAWVAYQAVVSQLPAPAVPGASEVVSPDPKTQAALAAVLGPLPPGLTFSVWSVKGVLHGTRLVVGGVCPQLDLSFAWAERSDAADPIDLGDRRLVSRGSRRVTAAVMQPGARLALLELHGRDGVLRERVRVAAGQLQVDVPERSARAPLLLEEVARTALAAADRLRAPDDIPARLAKNVASDPAPGVRVLSLQILLAEFPGHAATLAAQRTAAGSPLAPLRFVAARALGEEGRPILLEILRGPLSDDSAATAAVDALRLLPPEVADDVLARALVPKGGGVTASLTARAVIEALRRARVADLARLENALRCPADEVALEAVRLLGDRGGAEAVLPLQQMAEAHRSPEVRRGAGQAALEIQSRLPGATPGQLSLSGARSGAVTLAEDTAGRVSTPTGGSGPAGSP